MAFGSERERAFVRDACVERYAELLLGTCLGVEPGWQVIVWGTPWARPLLEEIMKQLGERGAYPLLRLTFSGGSAYHRAWVRHAPLEVISEPASIEVHAWEHCDAFLGVAAPENTRRRRGHPRGADERCRAGVSRRQVTPPPTGDALSAVLVSDAGTRPGHRDDAARVRGLHLRLLPDRLERSARAHLASCATLRRGRGSPDRRARHGPAGVRGRQAHGRRRRHRQHAGRRVLRLPDGDVGRGNDRLHRVPRDTERSRATGHPPPLLGGPDRRRVAPAGSASSGSAATPVSTARCGTSTSTRR